jgi:hypothetical protein
MADMSQLIARLCCGHTPPSGIRGRFRNICDVCVAVNLYILAFLLICEREDKERCRRIRNEGRKGNKRKEGRKQTRGEEMEMHDSFQQPFYFKQYIPKLD